MRSLLMRRPAEFARRAWALRRPIIETSVIAASLYRLEARDAHGRLKWRDEFHNLVTTSGLNSLLDARFGAGLAAPADYVGLKGVGEAVAADTMASHASWSELTSYTGARPAYVIGAIAAGAVNNSASPAQFVFTATSEIYGAFLADDDTVGGATGTLYGVGDFAAGAITGATAANPVVITSANHGLSAGSTIYIAGVTGMTQINGRRFFVANPATNTFELAGEDGSSHTAYTSGGRWSKFRSMDPSETLSVRIDLSLTSG